MKRSMHAMISCHQGRNECRPCDNPKSPRRSNSIPSTVSASTFGGRYYINAASAIRNHGTNRSGGQEARVPWPARLLPLPLPPPRTLAHGHEKDSAHSCGVRRKESSDVVIEESQAGGTQPLRVGREVRFAAQNSGL